MEINRNNKGTRQKMFIKETGQRKRWATRRDLRQTRAEQQEAVGPVPAGREELEGGEAGQDSR